MPPLATSPELQAVFNYSLYLYYYGTPRAYTYTYPSTYLSPNRCRRPMSLYASSRRSVLPSCRPSLTTNCTSTSATIPPRVYTYTYPSRRIYRRGFRDLEFCATSALGYAQIWGKGSVYFGFSGVEPSPPCSLILDSTVRIFPPAGTYSR